jgi:hypothetical protein
MPLRTALRSDKLDEGSHGAAGHLTHRSSASSHSRSTHRSRRSSAPITLLSTFGLAPKPRLPFEKQVTHLPLASAVNTTSPRSLEAPKIADV